MKFIHRSMVVSLLMISLHGEPALNDQQQKFVIGCHGRHAGLFALFFGALNNLAWCETHDKLPVIYWDKTCLYYVPEGFNGSTNVWEYYFEQPSLAKYNPFDVVHDEYLAPNGSGITLRYDNCKNYTGSKEMRAQVHAIIKKYIKIKPSIMQKVESFYRDNMEGKITLGIHIRGTDKKTEVTPVNHDIIFAKANELASKIPNVQFLVATDEAAILAKAERSLQGRVIYYNATRSKNGKPLHEREKRWKLVDHGVPIAQLGEDVLIEVQLLSRCSFFLHTCSNVSSAVLFFNPELDNILFTA